MSEGDYGWTDDAEMPSGEQLIRGELRNAYGRGRRSTDHPLADGEPLPLTPLEAQALALVAEGMTQGEIGAALHCDGKNAVKQIRRKLDARNLPHAVALAFRWGLLT